MPRKFASVPVRFTPSGKVMLIPRRLPNVDLLDGMNWMKAPSDCGADVLPDVSPRASRLSSRMLIP